MPFHLLDVPHWDQLQDPWGASGLDPYRTQDCGEECLAEVAWYYRRWTLSAYHIRLQIPGHADSGLTTGADLAGWLNVRGMPSSAVETDATQIRRLCREEVFAGRPVILLGWYAGPAELHWVVVRGSGDGRAGFNDSWGGLYREASWAWMAAHFGGQLVKTSHPAK